MQEEAGLLWKVIFLTLSTPTTLNIIQWMSFSLSQILRCIVMSLDICGPQRTTPPDSVDPLIFDNYWITGYTHFSLLWGSCKFFSHWCAASVQICASSSTEHLVQTQTIKTFWYCVFNLAADTNLSQNIFVTLVALLLELLCITGVVNSCSQLKTVTRSIDIFLDHFKTVAPRIY